MQRKSTSLSGETCPTVRAGTTGKPWDKQPERVTGARNTLASRRTPTLRDERTRAANPRPLAEVTDSAGRGNPVGDGQESAEGIVGDRNEPGKDPDGLTAPKARTPSHREEPCRTLSQ